MRANVMNERKTKRNEQNKYFRGFKKDKCDRKRKTDMIFHEY